MQTWGDSTQTKTTLLLGICGEKQEVLQVGKKTDDHKKLRHIFLIERGSTPGYPGSGSRQFPWEHGDLRGRTRSSPQKNHWEYPEFVHGTTLRARNEEHQRSGDEDQLVALLNQPLITYSSNML